MYVIRLHFSMYELSEMSICENFSMLALNSEHQDTWERDL